MRDPLQVMRFREEGLRSEVGATFGRTRTPTERNPHGNHQGWDLAAHPGTPCRAIENGVVQSVGYHRDYGHYVNIVFQARLPNGAAVQYSAFYAHLTSYSVHRGQTVRAGEVIGLTGSSGNAAGGAPHLHFEIHSVVDRAIVGLGLEGRKDPGEILGYHHYSTQRVRPDLEPVNFTPMRMPIPSSTPAPSATPAPSSSSPPAESNAGPSVPLS